MAALGLLAGGLALILGGAGSSRADLLEPQQPSSYMADNPPNNPALIEALDVVCTETLQRTCGVGAVRRNDHIYVYPTADASQYENWRRVCLKAPDFDRRVAQGVPTTYSRYLMALPSNVLAAWVAAGGPLDDGTIETVTFCGFELEDVLQLDWSATEARIRFDLVQFGESVRPPLGTVASRGVFDRGLSIDRSTIVGDLWLEDGRFVDFVEIERSRFEAPLRVVNTRIGGAFRLRGNVFEAPVRLEAVSIGGDTIIADNTFPSLIDDQPREADGTSFSVVRLRELRLGGVLAFVDNAFVRGEPPSIAVGARRARSLYLQKSTIRDNDVTFHRNTFVGRVYLTEVEGKKITVSGNSFSDFFEFSSSNVYSFRSFANNILGPFSVTNNRIESSLIIESDLFDSERTKLLDIRGNQVGHEMRFAPKSWPAENYTVDFSFNDVVGPFSFYWPLMNANGRRVIGCAAEPDAGAPGLPRWQGEINLVGTRVETSMRLVEGCLWDLNGQVAPLDDPPPADTSTVAPVGSSRPAHSTMVDLTLVEAGVLRLDLPADGAYAWRGKGLAFEFFGDSNQSQVSVVNGGKRSGQKEQTANDQLVAWLDRLERPDPEVYFAVADYLRGRGEIDRSREWLARGRAVDFGPTNCTGLVDCSRGWVTKAILFPSDFGTRPELVAVWLIVLWVAMTFVYWLHHRGLLARFEGSARPSLLPVVATGHGPGLEENLASWDSPGSARPGNGAPADDGPQDYPTRIEGFVAHKPEHANRRFSLWVYSLDVTLPVIPLDHFRVFTPTSTAVRGLSIVHHVAGWWLVTLFFGASFF